MEIKTSGLALISAATFLIGSSLIVCARQTAAPVQSTLTSDQQAALQAIEATTPLPATSTPDSGNFYTVQHEDDWPPLPGNPLNLPFWDLGNGVYLLDDTNVDYAALQAESDAAAAAGSNSRFSMMTSSSLNSSLAYANPVYLTNMAATLGSTSTVASFSIAGGTNFVPYDIVMTTDLSNSISQSQWTWLGVGYTSNSYSFSNQPVDQAFYALARPQNTMTVSWGSNSDGQTDVPFGLSNVVAVAGGVGHSLALLNDGTVRAWGQNVFYQGSVPTNIAGVTMIAAGWYHNVVLRSNGTVSAWGFNFPPQGDTLTNVPSNLTNATVISAQGWHSLALTSNGTVVAWGYNTAWGETNVPPGLSNVVAISAGYGHNLAATSDGKVIAWGYNGFGQTNVPANLSNVVDVAAGLYHSLALLSNGTVVAWGDNRSGATNVPVDLSNVVAIAAGGNPFDDSGYSVALKSDGKVVLWGKSQVLNPIDGLTDVIVIGAGTGHALAIRTGPPTPVITLEPVDVYQAPGASANLTAHGEALAAVQYLWQFDGTNISWATNATLTLTNVQSAQQGNYQVIVSDANGSITSSIAAFTLLTPPVVVSQTPMPTNQTAIYDLNLTLSVTATAPDQAHFPLSYQWKLNGTNISGATSNSYTFFGDTNTAGIYAVTVSNSAGSTNVSWQVTVNYAGSLAYHLATNAVGYASGYTGSDSDLFELSNWTYGIYSGTNLALLTNAVWSTNFWLHGVRGLSATSIGGSNGLGGQGLITMVSPRHYLFASHTHPEGFLTAFLDTNNVIYWRTTLQRVDLADGHDTSVGILNADLPSSVGFLPVVPTNLLSYLPTNTTSYVQGVGMNQNVRVFSQPMTFYDPVVVNWNSSNTIPFGLATNWSVAIRSGDSSNPERLLVGNQLVSVSDNEGVFGGPNYANEFNAINQMMHYLSTNNGVGTDYQLTPFSLTNWSALH